MKINKKILVSALTLATITVTTTSYATDILSIDITPNIDMLEIDMKSVIEDKKYKVQGQGDLLEFIEITPSMDMSEIDMNKVVEFKNGNSK